MPVPSIALALLTPSAEACGGFACASVPVLQAAERIVFGMDEEGERVEMHVQITFEGEADDFSWIVPTPKVPELFLTTGALFTQVAIATQPRFVLNIVEEGYCGDGLEFGFGAEYDLKASATPSTASGVDESGVTVVAEQAVGPYDTVTLQADSTEALLGWLDDNGYDIPVELEDALGPYVQRDGYFVALKLQKDEDVGDLAPLGLRFDAAKATVPVQLTAVSATPDMRMETYVLGGARGVPESYLHVKINDAAVDWWTGGSNYTDVITQAANEAGGHAFATDYFGATDIVPPLYDAGMVDADRLASIADPVAWTNELRSMLLVAPPELFPLLEEIMDLSAGDGANFYGCPDCFSQPQGFDPKAATTALREIVLDPLAAAQDLLDRSPWLSRMTSSLDAVEMTVDPVFVLNHDMTDDLVRRRKQADFVYECGNGRSFDRADRRLVLADGREIAFPSAEWLREHGMTEFEYIEELGEKKAQIIEQTGAEGEPVVIADFTDDLAEQVRLFNRALGCAGGGCSSTGPAGLGLLAGSLALLGARRRRS